MKTKYTKYLRLYYAPWCGHCKNFEPTWEKIKKILEHNKVKQDLNKLFNTTIILEKYDDNHPITKDAGINGYPTIVIITEKNNKKNKEKTFNDERTLENLIYSLVKSDNDKLTEWKKWANINDNTDDNNIIMIQNGGYNSNYYFKKYLKYKKKYLLSKK